MSKENNRFKELITKENKYEHYILLALGAFAIIMSLLIYFDVFTIKLSGETLVGNKKVVFVISFLTLGLVSLIISINKIKKDLKYKRTVYHELIDDYNNNQIKKNLFSQDLELDKLTIEYNKNNLGFDYKVENGSFYLYVDKQQVVFSFEYNDEFIENMTDEEVEKLPLWEIGGFHSTLDFDKANLYKEYIKFIKDNQNG